MTKKIGLSGLPQAIEKLYPGFSNKESILFFSQWKNWECEKDELILRPKQIADYIWFVEKGCIRIYYNKEDRDITEWIALDQQFFMSITSFFKRSPSRLIVQTLEKTSLWGIHYNDLMRLADEHVSIGKLLRYMVIQSLILSQERMESIQFETALQRYQRLLTNSPDIIQRVSMQYIASFLGITKETLSRIRSMQ